MAQTLAFSSPVFGACDAKPRELPGLKMCGRFPMTLAATAKLRDSTKFLNFQVMLSASKCFAPRIKTRINANAMAPSPIEFMEQEIETWEEL
jgi:hypothetical protein